MIPAFISVVDISNALERVFIRIDNYCLEVSRHYNEFSECSFVPLSEHWAFQTVKEAPLLARQAPLRLYMLRGLQREMACVLVQRSVTKTLMVDIKSAEIFKGICL